MTGFAIWVVLSTLAVLASVAWLGFKFGLMVSDWEWEYYFTGHEVKRPWWLGREMTVGDFFKRVDDRMSSMDA